MAEKQALPPAIGGVQQVQSSREVQGSPWGGGGFVDYGGAAAESFQRAFGLQEQRAAYEKSVKDEELKELDADFGKLIVGPSGVGGFDGSTEMMAREWKSEYVAAKRAYDKGDMDPAEFSQIKNRLFSNAQQFQDASKILTQTVNDYSAAVDEGLVSDSTPPEIRDVLDTLKKGGQTLTVANINGIPTLTGTTIQGMPVEVPISEIASGKNTWRFNEKFNTGDALDKIYTKYEKIKIDYQNPDGSVERKTPSFEQLGERISEDVDNLLNNESTVRAIFSDDLKGTALDYEQDPEAAKAEVAAYLTDKLQREYYPTTQIVQRQFAPQQQRSAHVTAAQIKAQEQARVSAENAQLLNTVLQPDSSGNYPSAKALVGRSGITQVKPFRFSNGFYVYKGGEKYEIYPNEPAGQQILANLLGVGNLQQSGQGASANEADPLGLNL